EILCGLFSLLSLCAYAAWYRRAPRDPVGRFACAAALVAYALALLSKEMAAIVPVLALLLEPLLAAAPVAAVASAPPPEAVAAGATRFSAWARGVARRQAGYLLVLTAYMIVRSWAIGGVAPGTPPLEALHIPGGQRVLLMAQVFGDYVRLMVLPAPLLAVHRCNSVRAAMLADFAQPATWFGLLALAGAAFTVWVAVRRGRPGVAVGVAWFYVALLPVSNLLVPIGVIYSERALYLPSVGPCVLLAGLIFALAGRVAAPGTRRLLLLALPALGLLVPWAAMTRARNEVWRTQATLFQDLVERDPQNPRNWLGLAQVALDGGRLDEGLGLYDQAVALGANDPFTRRNRGMLHLTAGRARLAEADLTAALAGLPAGSRAAVSVRLGRAAARRALGDPAGAHDDLAAAAAAAPDDPDVCVAYGESWMRSGRPAAALSWFERAVARAPRNGAAHDHRAFAMEALGRFAEAWDALAPALELPAPLPARAGVLRDLLRVELGRELEAAAPALDAATAGDSALAARALAPLARAWLTLGRPEAAREAVRRLRALGVVVPADLEGLDRR
ncbi:MAG: tetratricopeptide repeat protein, partial [Planctomycetes bacterium]|nr:tetratricopeptide repeat protein [Planctomycetota bacterium]